MAWLRKLLLFLFFPVAAFGQGMRYDNFVLKPLNTGGVTPVSGALITVCTSAGTGTPCTPKVANIYSDEALTVPITGTGGAGTTNSDANGNFGFYASPGSYIVTVTGSGFTSYTIKLVLPIGNATGATFTGTVLCKNFEQVRCVDAANSQGWAGSDIGGWINSAYADAPSGGTVIVRLSPNGAVINFSTPIVFGTAGKQGLLDLNGATINYTPTTATTAVTLSDAPSVINFTIAHGVINGNLTNNSCITNGGCGSSATGINLANNPSIGPPFSNLTVSGFGTGMTAAGGATNSWGTVSGNVTFAYNTTGLVINNPYENFSIFGSRFISNGTGISGIGPTTDLFIHGASFDANLTVGILNTGIVECHGCHFENNNGAGGGVTTHYVDSTGGFVSIVGGNLLDDQTTGNTDWWIRSTGSVTLSGNPVFFSAGRTATAVVQINTPGYGDLRYINNSSGVLTAFIGGTSTSISSFESLSQQQVVTGRIDVVPSSTNGARINSNGFHTLGSASRIGFSPGSPAAANPDVALTRDAAGVIDVGNGNFQDISGKLKLANVLLGATIQNTAATATMGLILKKGSGAGNYTSASTTYVVVDSTNLCNTVTIPTGWSLSIAVSAYIGTNTAVADSQLALTDNAACSTANAGILQESAPIDTTAAGKMLAAPLGWKITGDGASHSIALQFKTANAADSVILANSSATLLPTMIFQLEPSN